jgi:hypothetical protein
LQDVEADLRFLEVGNSIHNMHYAGSLIQALIDKLRPVCRDLNIEEPTANLPTETGLVE